MKTRSKKIPLFLGIWGWVLATAFAALADPPGDNSAIQALQQAPDPSAVVAAYANGAGVDRNDPKLDEAYVTRMVDLGLPELAYHQAQSLTILDPGNGLAWGVVAYVDARRGQMPEALDAINRAAHLASDIPFVQRTAGEALAWYDHKADKSTIPADTQNELVQTRALLGTTGAFTTAYDTASKAYQAQASVNQQPAREQPAQAAPAYAQTQYQPYQTVPGGYAQPGYPLVNYYPDYYYDWGPGWVQPAPWYWWQPAGFFSGFAFFPFSTTFVFDNDRFFEHHHHFVHDHDNHFSHQHHNDQFVAHHDQHNPMAWHQSAGGHGSFFGTPMHPNTAVAQSTFHGQQAMSPTMSQRHAATMSGMTANHSVITHNSGFTMHQSQSVPFHNNSTAVPQSLHHSMVQNGFAAQGHQTHAFAAPPAGGFHSAGGMGGGFHGTGGGHGGGGGGHH